MEKAGMDKKVVEQLLRALGRESTVAHVELAMACLYGAEVAPSVRAWLGAQRAWAVVSGTVPPRERMQGTPWSEALRELQVEARGRLWARCEQLRAKVVLEFSESDEGKVPL